MKISLVLSLGALCLAIFLSPVAAGTEALRDLAQGMPATASVSAPGHGPEKAVDGSFGTQWLAGRGRSVASTAETATTMWRWTAEEPAGAWMEPDFDDSAWRESRGGFGSAGTPNALIGTAWSSGDIWLRREVELTEADLESDLRLRVYHDNDAEVFLNGVQVLALEGHRENYEMFGISPEARAALRPGRNLLAIHCRQEGGGQFVDAGILAVEPVWWEVDLGAPTQIEAMEIALGSAAAGAPFRVEWSLDGRTWSTYSDHPEGAGTGAVVADRNSQKLRHLRVVFPGAAAEGNPAQIREFLALGAP